MQGIPEQGEIGDLAEMAETPAQANITSSFAVHHFSVMFIIITGLPAIPVVQGIQHLVALLMQVEMGVVEDLEVMHMDLTLQMLVALVVLGGQVVEVYPDLRAMLARRALPTPALTQHIIQFL